MPDQLIVRDASLSESTDPIRGADGPDADQITRYTLKLVVENASAVPLFVISTITGLRYDDAARTLHVRFDSELLTARGRQPSMTTVAPQSRSSIEGRLFSSMTFDRGVAHADGPRLKAISIPDDVDTLDITLAFTAQPLGQQVPTSWSYASYEARVSEVQTRPSK